MLPTGHIEYTWATLHLLQRKAGLFQEADYRWMAVAAMAPDLLDKPLALTLYRDQDAALFWGHNLWLHAVAWVVVVAWFRWTRASARGVHSRDTPTPGCGAVLPYLMAFSGHLVADRMWGFQESLFYPLGAGRWHPWVHVGEPAAMLGAYVEIVRTTPVLVFFEVSGLALLGWFINDCRLWQRARLARFLRSGRVEPVRDATGASGLVTKHSRTNVPSGRTVAAARQPARRLSTRLVSLRRSDLSRPGLDD
jgi:hypothetical protein